MKALRCTVSLALGLSSAWGAPGPRLELHQALEEAWQARGLDLADSAAVLAWVFRQLPEEVRVYPTENYYYWRLAAGGREIRGNFRPASGLREKGQISFAYEEWLEFPDEALAKGRISAVRLLGAAEGLRVTCPSPLTCDVTLAEKTVRFHLHALPQLPPAAPGLLGPGERFIARTWDESGLPFFLCYETRDRCFFWVLNEEQPVAETFVELAPGVALGRRSGFCFWTDPARAARKVLSAVREASILRNDSYDGPFDQLADNYAAQVPLRATIEDAFPSLKGQIDLYGYFTSGPDQGQRVALTSYLAYASPAQALAFTQRAAQAAHPVAAIAAGGKDR